MLPLLGDVLRRVDHVEQRARTLEVREELVAEADALARTLDQARHVGDDQLAAVGPTSTVPSTGCSVVNG